MQAALRRALGVMMSIASVSTITSASPVGWQDALERGFERARQTLRGITGIQVIEEKARVENGKISEFLVTMQVIFVLEDDAR
jgi:dodecin